MKKKDNKGFTLVELIVVLVILAILAAILVPALLGYIDRAKNQQIVLNAKSCMTSAQAELSSLYGSSTAVYENSQFTIPKTSKERIWKTADVPVTDSSKLVIGVGAAPTTTSGSKHDPYTIQYVAYTEGEVTLYYDITTKSWIETDPNFTATQTVQVYPIENTNNNNNNGGGGNG